MNYWSTSNYNGTVDFDGKMSSENQLVKFSFTSGKTLLRFTWFSNTIVVKLRLFSKMERDLVFKLYKDLVKTIFQMLPTEDINKIGLNRTIYMAIF